MNCNFWFYSILEIIDGDTISANSFDGNFHFVDIAQNIWLNELFRRPLMRHLTFAHGNDMVGITGGEIDVVQHQNDSFAQIIRCTPQKLHHRS